MVDIGHTLLFIAVGAVIGAVGGVFGIGGALIAIPLLSLGFGLDQQHAQGTSLVMGAPNCLIGMWRYAQHPAFDRRATIIMALSALPLTYVGAYIAVHVAGRSLRPMFSAFIILLAVWSIVRAVRRGPIEPTSIARKPERIAVLGGAVGGLSGLFSSGGAAVAVPFLSLLFGYSQATSQGMALGLVTPGSIISLVTYALAGAVDWQIGIPLAIGGTLFITQGVALAHRLPERTLRLFFSGLLIVSALALFRTT